MRNLWVIFLLCVLTLSAVIVWSQNRKVKEQPETMPLVPMMRLLLADMQQLNEGIYTGNFRLITEAAGSIADHPGMTEEDKKLVKNRLGDEIKKFIALDMQVHHHSDSIRIGAQKMDMQKVLRHYTIVQHGCVSCHSEYREQISKARMQNK